MEWKYEKSSMRVGKAKLRKSRRKKNRFEARHKQRQHVQHVWRQICQFSFVFAFSTKYHFCTTSAKKRFMSTEKNVKNEFPDDNKFPLSATLNFNIIKLLLIDCKTKGMKAVAVNDTTFSLSPIQFRFYHRTDNKNWKPEIKNKTSKGKYRFEIHCFYCFLIAWHWLALVKVERIENRKPDTSSGNRCIITSRLSAGVRKSACLWELSLSKQYKIIND